MPEELPSFTDYQPDEGPRRRLEQARVNKPSVTVDKPINFRVGRTRPATLTKHYPRKTRKRIYPDLRNPQYY